MVIPRRQPGIQQQEMGSESDVTDLRLKVAVKMDIEFLSRVVFVPPTGVIQDAMQTRG